MKKKKDFWEIIVQIRGALVDMHAPFDVRDAALQANWKIDGETLVLIIPQNLQEYLERNMDVFRPILLPFMEQNNIKKLIYNTPLNI